MKYFLREYNYNSLNVKVLLKL